MSLTFTLVGTESVLNASYFPPIELDPNEKYSLGLVGFYSYHSIPNIDEGSNKFYYGSKSISLPAGSYEIGDLERYINEHVEEKDRIILRPNLNTFHAEIYSEENAIDFRKDDSLFRILGFPQTLLQAKQLHVADKILQIFNVTTIRVSANITSGAYLNDELVHTIHEFSLNVAPGYAISEAPRNIIYLPVITSSINNITLRISDQNDKLINFRGEEVVVRLELKKI